MVLDFPAIPQGKAKRKLLVAHRRAGLLQSSIHEKENHPETCSVRCRDRTMFCLLCGLALISLESELQLVKRRALSHIVQVSEIL